MTFGYCYLVSVSVWILGIGIGIDLHQGISIGMNLHQGIDGTLPISPISLNLQQPLIYANHQGSFDGMPNEVVMLEKEFSSPPLELVSIKKESETVRIESNNSVQFWPR